MKNIHDIQPGKFGVVAHKMKPDQLNCWINLGYQESEITIWMGSVPWYNGNPLVLSYHIPHGTLVLVTAPARDMIFAGIDPKLYYRILWNEIDCWIKKELLINPYFNEDD